MLRPRNLLALVFVLAALAASATCGCAEVRHLDDVVYAKIGERELHMDLVIPEVKPGERHPAIAWIHGGAWSGGTYKRNPAAQLVSQGYVVASVEYRLSGEAKFPAQITDCKAAIRFLRARAKDYGIDPDRIGVCGASAGGHLVALLGTTGGNKELEGGYGSLGESSSVRAVYDMCGPTDLTIIPPELASAYDPVTALLGGTVRQKPEMARLASPVKHVSKSCPPFLIVHGEQDQVVPISQSEALYTALRAAGVEATLVKVRNAGHGFNGANVEPTPEKMALAALEFFDKHLKTKQRK